MMDVNKLQRQMAEKGISQLELAKRIGYTQAYISQIVNGLKTPSVIVAKMIADVLDCKIDDLV